MKKSHYWKTVRNRKNFFSILAASFIPIGIPDRKRTAPGVPRVCAGVDPPSLSDREMLKKPFVPLSILHDRKSTKRSNQNDFFPLGERDDLENHLVKRTSYTPAGAVGIDHRLGAISLSC